MTSPDTQDTEELIDVRTKRPFGDHGTANQALAFALDVLPFQPEGCPEPDTFLRAWREGDLDEWPEFYTWLAAADAKTRPDSPVTVKNDDVQRRLESVANTLETCGKHGIPIDFKMLAHDIREALARISR